MTPRRLLVRITSGIVLAWLGACADAGAPWRPSDDPDPETRLLWSLTQFRGRGSPGYDREKVYFATADHQVVAVDRKNGQHAWTTHLPVDRPEYYGSGIVVIDSMVVVGDQDVFGIDARSGEIRWRFAPPGVWNAGLMRPGVAGSNVILGSTSGALLSMDPATGTANWMTQIPDQDSVRIFHPIVVEDDIYIGFTQTLSPSMQRGGVARVAASDGTIRWWRFLPQPADPLRPSATLEPAVAGNVVIAGSRDGPTFAFRRDNGQLAWSLPPVPELLTGFGAPYQELAPLASDGKLLFIGSTRGRIRAVDPATGEIVWQRGLEIGATGWLAADEHAVVEVFPLGDLRFLDPRTGDVLFLIPNHVAMAVQVPTLTPDAVYFNSSAGLFAAKR